MSPYDRLTRDNLEGLINPDWLSEDQEAIAKSERLAGRDLEREREKWQAYSDFTIGQ